MFSLRQQSARRQVERLIRRGVGVRERAWPCPGAQDGAGLADAIAGWVREAMGEMRRPSGIDHVALAVACRDRAGRVLCSNSFGVVRPALFYGEEGPARLRAFLDDAAALGPGEGREVVAALLSLGDIACALRAA